LPDVLLFGIPFDDALGQVSSEVYNRDANAKSRRIFLEPLCVQDKVGDESMIREWTRRRRRKKRWKDAAGFTV